MAHRIVERAVLGQLLFVNLWILKLLGTCVILSRRCVKFNIQVVTLEVKVTVHFLKKVQCQSAVPNHVLVITLSLLDFVFHGFIFKLFGPNIYHNCQVGMWHSRQFLK